MPSSLLGLFPSPPRGSGCKGGWVLQHSCQGGEDPCEQQRWVGDLRGSSQVPAKADLP